MTRKLPPIDLSRRLARGLVAIVLLLPGLLSAKPLPATNFVSDAPAPIRSEAAAEEEFQTAGLVRPSGAHQLRLQSVRNRARWSHLIHRAQEQSASRSTDWRRDRASVTTPIDPGVFQWVFRGPPAA